MIKFLLSVGVFSKNTFSNGQQNILSPCTPPHFPFDLFSPFLFLFLFSCKKTDAPQNVALLKGVNYFPLEVGKYITYEVDSIIYRIQSGSECIFVSDTSHSFLKEIIVDEYVDNEGAINFVVERFKKKLATDSWKIDDVWYTKKTETQVERVEEDLRFIKMIFPVREGENWKGNAFIYVDTIVVGNDNMVFYGFWSNDYKYESVDVKEEIGTYTFDSVMTVVQSDASDFKINYRNSIEKYARNVGLVYKEMQILDRQCCGIDDTAAARDSCYQVPWEVNAEKGLILYQRVIDYN